MTMHTGIGSRVLITNGTFFGQYGTIIDSHKIPNRSDTQYVIQFRDGNICIRQHYDLAFLDQIGKTHCFYWYNPHGYFKEIWQTVKQMWRRK